MGLPKAGDAASRFSAYVEGLASVIGHADRAKPLRDYCVGLMMPCERKSVEPMAAITAPERTAAQHQSLLHFVGEGNWSDEKVLAKVRELVLPEMERHGPIEAWIIDDTGFPKKGRHSVGVGRSLVCDLRECHVCPLQEPDLAGNQIGIFSIVPQRQAFCTPLRASVGRRRRILAG